MDGEFRQRTGRPPAPTQRQNPRTNAHISPSRAKSRRLCAGFDFGDSGGRQSRRSIATRRRLNSSVRKGTTDGLFALCHMHEALVHVQTQKQALLREEHRIGMERSRGISRAPLLIARVFDQQPTILRRGNATAQQEKHTR